MHLIPRALLSTGLLATLAVCSPQAQQTGRLQAAITLPTAITNGVAIAPDGRTFMAIAKQKGQDVPQIAEWVNGELRPYPDASWNAWKPGEDASSSFQHANSIRFGPDGTLWIVDVGSPEMGQPVLPHGPKLVGVNISTGKVVRVLYFDRQTKPQSFLDDVRFNGDHAYLTDAGAPGLIIVHMPDGSMYRVLDDDTSTTAQTPLRAEGRELRNPQGQPVYLHADQLEVSPDGRTLYYQPCSGPLSAIDVQYIDEQRLTDAERRTHVRTFAHNGTAGGTAMDAQGNVYVSDTDRNAVLRITPGGEISTVVQDPRLVWVDAMWITTDGKLWMPAAQLNRTPSMNGARMAVKFPMVVYTVDIGTGPPRNDHR